MALKSYKAILRDTKMDEGDYIDFTNFRDLIGKGFTDNDLEIVYKLHAKYFNHKFIIPCGCGGVKKMDTINTWIQDLEKVYDNGMET
tara:strand:- start:209 stop:469 length:261 start_codon:yes stop_codon:yes gene_type:complete